MVSEKKNSYSFWLCVFDWGVSIMFPLFQFPIVPVWLHKHAMRAFFVVEKHTRGYFSFHCSRLATQARHACLFCCRETHAWVLQFPLFPFGYTSTPCVPFLLSENTRVGTYHLHGKTGNSGLKIKWFPPLRLGSFRNYGLWFEAVQFFYSF